jgi:PAS domain-containing protein
MEIQTQRPALRVVDGALEVGWSWFCGHCAAPSPRNEPPLPTARVCHSCGLGLYLETRDDVLPAASDAFLVVDGALRVQAVSNRAERLLSVAEEAVVDEPITKLIVPADAEAIGSSAFAGAVADVMARDEPGHAFVRPWNTFGVRMRARIASCGPPRAALVVLETSPRPLRLV